MISWKQIGVRRGPMWGERLGAKLLKSDGNIMAWMERHTQVLKSDKHSTVGLLELEQQACYLKYYRHKSWAQRALFQLGIGRGFRSFDGALALLEKHVPVPEPLSCVLIPGGMLLLTQAMQPACDLKAEWLDGPDANRKAELMANAGLALHRLHVAGYCHGDSKWSNFLWSQGQFYLVDLEAVESVAADVLGSKKQARDIARFVLNAEDLSLTPAEFEPFMHAYLDQSKVSENALIGAIMPALNRLRRRHDKHYGARGTRLIGEQ
jgi:tRNA A-37 threonylcarbamoyl transferase component Bud32